jgi:hypothetical protein
MTLASVVIAFFDTEGSFVQYYPFRMSALSCFLIGLQCYLMVREKFAMRDQWEVVQRTVFIFAMAYIAKFFVYDVLHNYRYPAPEGFLEATQYIKENTTQDSVVLYLEGGSIDGDLRFMRYAERDRFCAYKMDPGGTNKYYDWYARVLAKREIMADIHKISEHREKFRMDYVLSSKPKEVGNLSEIFSNEQYFVYKVKAED